MGGWVTFPVSCARGLNHEADAEDIDIWVMSWLVLGGTFKEHCSSTEASFEVAPVLFSEKANMSTPTRVWGYPPILHDPLLNSPTAR